MLTLPIAVLGAGLAARLDRRGARLAVGVFAGVNVVVAIAAGLVLMLIAGKMASG
jgi:hypothetical protein